VKIQYRIVLTIFLALSTTATLAKSSEVIDLGSLKVEGAARGPELNVIEPGMDEMTAGKILMSEVRKMELRLLPSDLTHAKLEGTRK
jgi:hypothetical protein